MKLIKMTGLAAVAALAAMAFLGASTASADKDTALCTIDALVCPTINLVDHVHQEDPAALLLNSITGYIECAALFLGHVVDEDLLATAPDPLHLLGDFSYSSCEDESGRNCTATEVSATASILILKLSAELGDVKGSAEVLVRCGFFIHCIYNGEGLEGKLLGPLPTSTNGITEIHNGMVTSTGGFLCPETAELDTLYVSLPDPIYLSS